MKFFLLFFSLALALSLSATETEVQRQYPFFRQFRSGFNILFGSTSYLAATDVLRDSESTDYEKENARILQLIGLVRLGDGLWNMFSKSLPEQYLREGKLNPGSKEYKHYLSQAAEFERKLRFYRASVILANGLGFLSLYLYDTEKNKTMIIPGAGMFLVSFYAFWKRAPSEEDLFQIDLTPTITSHRDVIPALTLAWRF